MKRHRDIFYTNAKKWNQRPISAIITTLATKISNHTESSTGVYDLLVSVVSDLFQYAMLLEGKHPGFYANYEERAYIKKEDQKWKILNPVDPNDNYADSWDEVTAKLFFKWVQAVNMDFVETFERADIEYYTGLKNGLGSYLVESVLPESITQHKPTIITGTKPWRRN